MRAIIVGAGRLGVETAEALMEAGHEVTLVEIDDERAQRLDGALPFRVLFGDGCDPMVLEEAGSLNAEVLVATTGDDEDNLVISLLAKRQFDVPRVVARINHPENRWLFTDRWGVDVAVSAATSLMSQIEEATATADTVDLLDLASAGVSVIETLITDRSLAAGRTLAEIRLPAATIVATVVRGGEPKVPNGSFRLEVGDEVLVVSESATADDIHAAFQGDR
jgi:trk system potassium uptake protein TrkA